MAVVIRVDPAYNGKIAVQSNNALNGTVLSNNLSQETLLSIYTNQPELRVFLTTEYSNALGSYFPATIDPNLLHAYDSGELTHNAAKTDYPANTLGKVVNDNKASFDALAGGFGRPALRPILNLDFANGRFLDPAFSFTRNSVGTYIDRNGFVKTVQANKPRFTFDPLTGECLGLLLEESRTNLLRYSTDCSNAAWGKISLAISASDTIGPNGTLAEASLVTDNAVATESALTQGVTITDATTHTFSVWAKAGTIGTAFKMQVSSTGGGVTVTYNLNLGTRLAGTTYGAGFTFVSSAMTLYPNGWYRCELSFTSSASFTLNTLIIPVTGAHTASASQNIYIYGPQLAKGADATSYIPTAATTVTREQDMIVIAGTQFSQLFGAINKGTIFVSAAKGKVATGNGKYAMLQGVATAGGANRIGVIANTNGSVEGFVMYDGVTQNSANIVPATNSVLMAYAFANNDAKVYVNGVASADDNAVVIPALNELRIGSDTSPNAPVKQICIWGERLTNTELQYLSTPSTKLGKDAGQAPSNGDLGRGAYVSPEAILRSLGKSTFAVDGTGASITRNVRFPFDFTFEVLDSSGVTTITTTPASTCTANTDNPLTFTAPIGKTLSYAITPVF
ncbi:hypothetical protein VB264_05330 [Arcicella aquatica]|uniref:Uncharacterized protein n=1 Tax=Arcicella aquatica TaxID=217141 RepID=A0ABU5QKC4_9BACT|nr:hypothetical protein [Arcicella aquatica]MEA5257199.1 hypothetical protein [Arcicella aquatica]